MTVYVCGAGGKTTYILRRAQAAAARSQSVLITTTTHMLRTGQTITDPDEAAAACAKGRIVMAGAPDPKSDRKIVGFPEEAAARLKERFDFVLIEADGARHRQIKVPKSHEPVIHQDADEIIVISGSRASSLPIREAAYNAEAVAAIAGKSTEETLTEEDIERVIREGYLEPLRKMFPQIPVRHVHGCERKIHLILLAAGYSTRFGSNKLLCEIDGKPMYRHTADMLLELIHENDRTSAVEGPDRPSSNRLRLDLTAVTQYPEIAGGLSKTDAEIVMNPDPSRGISSSIQCAITSLKERGALGGDDFLVFFPADQPFLKKSTTAAFLEGLDKSGMRLGAVTDGSEMRSPCAFASEYAEELMALTGDTGGKKILKRHEGEIFLFSAIEQEELEDMDTLC